MIKLLQDKLRDYGILKEKYKNFYLEIYINKMIV